LSAVVDQSINQSQWLNSRATLMLNSIIC